MKKKAVPSAVEIPKDSIEWQFIDARGTRIVMYDEAKMREFIAEQYLAFAHSWDPTRTCDLKLTIMRVEKRYA